LTYSGGTTKEKGTATITPEVITFMATHGKDLICLAMTGERLDGLEFAPMAPDNTALGSEGARRRQTKFSCDTRALFSASTAFLQAKALNSRHTALR
jgi:3,4-dihydroxy-2-butanone 4-phosphate synthase